MPGPFIAPVASSIPFDNSSNGFVSDNVQAAIEEARNAVVPGNAMYHVWFTRNADVAKNAYLHCGLVVTSRAGILIRNTAIIIGIDVTSSQMIPHGFATFQLQQRTGVNTFVDIPGASITIHANNYRAISGPMNINIGNNCEISCYNAGPARVQDVVLRVLLYVTSS